MVKKKETRSTPESDTVCMMTPRGEVIAVPSKKVPVKKSWGWAVLDEKTQSTNKGKE